MGFSLGEIFLLVVVGIIVVGPKNLPPMMRTLGQWVARLRRMSNDLRSQSGIDDLIRQEGLQEHIHELRSLARVNVVDSLMAPVASAVGSAAINAPPAPLDQSPRPKPYTWTAQEPLREREYPLAGCDAYGALPDDSAPYAPDPVPVPVPVPESPAVEPEPAKDAAPEAQS